MDVIEEVKVWDFKNGKLVVKFIRLFFRDKNGRFFYAEAVDTDVDVDRVTYHEILVEHIRPLYTQDITRAPDRLLPDTYVKTSSLENYIPDCPDPFRCSKIVMGEVKVCELLSKAPHPNVAEYLGCKIEDGRIAAICYRLYERDLASYLQRNCLSDAERVLAEIKAALNHLHKLRVVHNDIKPSNIMLSDGRIVIIDFDCSACFGQRLCKIAGQPCSLARTGRSSRENELFSLKLLERLLLEGIYPSMDSTGFVGPYQSDNGHKVCW